MVNSEPGGNRRRWGLGPRALLRALAAFGIVGAICWSSWPVGPRLTLSDTRSEEPKALSPYGRLVVTTTCVPHYIQGRSCSGSRLWDTVRGREVILDPADHGGGLVSFSPDGSLMSVERSGGSTIYRLDERLLSDWRRARPAGLPVIARIPGLWVRAFSPDGRWLALNPPDGRERTILWDVDRRQQRHLLPGAGGRAEFTADGRLLVVQTPANGRNQPVQLKVWETATGRELGTIPNVAEFSWSLDPLGRVVAAGRSSWSSDPPGRVVGVDHDRIHLWSPEPFREVAVLPEVRNPVFLPDGKTLAAMQTSASSAGVVLYDTAHWSERARVKLSDQFVYQVMPHPDGRGLLFQVPHFQEVGDGLDEVNLIRRLDLASLRIETVLRDHFTDFWVASRGGTIVLKGWRLRRGDPNHDTGPIRIWDLPPRRPLAAMLTASAFAAFLAGTLSVWGALVATIARHIVMPAPRTRRTFGVLNLLVGVILVAIGIGVPMLVENVLGLFDDLEDPWSRYLLADLLSMLVLNALMIVSGLGLLAGRSWGGSLGVWTVLLKLIRLVLSFLALAYLVGPTEVMTIFLLVCFVALGAIYPLIFLRSFLRAGLGRSPGGTGHGT